jgi:hypothetical protein
MREELTTLANVVRVNTTEKGISLLDKEINKLQSSHEKLLDTIGKYLI